MLRTRRPYAAPTDDPAPGDDSLADILDRSEQTSVVQDLVERAEQAQREYTRAAIALSSTVLLLVAIFPLPRTIAAPFLAGLCALSLVVSLGRHLYALRTSTPLLALDVLHALPSALLSLLVLRGPADVQLRLLWGVAPFGVQLLGLLLHWEGRRGVREAQGLRGLMYDAPEA